MPAEIEATSGPLQGSVFPIEGEVSIGREPSNTIAILEGSISRRHCVLVNDGGRCTIRDLESRNSTYVNGAAITECELTHGDEIKIGSSLFRFRIGKDSTSEQPPASGRAPTIVLRREDAVYLKPSDGSGALPATTRTVRDLKALLRISRLINSVAGLEPLECQILESISEVIPADRAAIVFAGGPHPDFSAAIGWDRRLGSNQMVEVSRTIAKRVVDEGVAVLSNDLSEYEGFSDAESVVLRQIRSALAVPLEIFDRILGVIYLDASDPAVRFDEADLQLLTAIGSLAAVALENARRMDWLEAENRRLQAEINLEHNMVGDGPRMRDVYQFINRVAPTDSTVLICGESGTGKELVARAMHQNSPRTAKPYMAINCAALTDTLLESELFGHEKGAFTGAMAQKKGKLESAEGGTVFLDEIGELAPALQAKLLRVLQEREFERVGGTKTIKLNIRVIAATNRDLEQEVKQGRFRQDLYYRLNVVSIRMPALRERREDVSLLASYFVTKFASRLKRTVTGISPEARLYLAQYDWPGNVRELENTIERAVVLGSSEIIRAEDLPESILEKGSPAGAAGAAFHGGVREAKKQIILSAIDQAGGNYTEAAKLLDLHPNYLHRLIRNLNLKGAVGSAIVGKTPK